MTAGKGGYVALVGRPNVGKSTLFNRLTRSRQAIVDGQPGVTRDRHYGLVKTDQGSFTLIDTGGFEPWADQGLPQLMKAQVEAALDQADLIIFLLDGRLGLNPLDREIASLLRRRAKRVVTAVNKLDDPQMFDLAAEFHALGLTDPLPISAAHGLGIDDLLQAVAAGLPQVPVLKPEAEDVVRLAIVGRPNVGKSSLVNKILGAERMIVSETPGTTRDAVDTLVASGGRPYLLIDTAGLRRPGRIKTGVERWSVLRALKAMDRADLALVLIDATEGLTDQEARVCGLAVDRGRAVILAVNKWDLIDDPDRRFKDLKDELAFKLKFLSFVPWLVISAKTGRNLAKIFQAADQVFEQYSFRAPTAEVNQVLDQAVTSHPPPLAGRGRLKFYFATQAQTRPPTFVVFTNKPDQVHFSYARFLTNRFKEAFGLKDIPIKVKFKPRKRRP
ncbi:MAG: ribosome biogenesis GTPase Der [Deltaproteobacteria bacterium]|nr:ribosome biogenesis GTPase Der [Deltaproteobacteria bacterium]